MSTEKTNSFMDKQLFLSQQRVRDDVSARNESYCHFAASTGRVNQKKAKNQYTTDLECNVRFVEDKLTTGNMKALNIQKQYSVPSQFVQGNDPENENNEPEEDIIDTPIPCDYW